MNRKSFFTVILMRYNDYNPIIEDKDQRDFNCQVGG